MPFRYKIIENKKLLYAKATDTVTFSCLIDHLDEVCQDPKYKAPMKKLVDYRQIKKMDITMHEQERFAQKKASLKKLFFGEKCAIIVPTDFGFALGQVHASLSSCEDIETKAFRNFDEALSWLDVELDNG
jgi:hypothetical protein